MGLCDIDPVGVNDPSGVTGELFGGGSTGTPSGKGRHNITSLLAGDTLHVTAAGLVLDGEPINIRDFTILFGFSDQLFAEPLVELLYEPSEYLDEYTVDTGWIETPDSRMRITDGLVSVMLLPAFTDTLRRGSYIYSVRATNLTTGFTGTIVEGHVLTRYSPTTLHRNIPYKTSPVAVSSVTGES